jgi:hypothetical protein
MSQRVPPVPTAVRVLPGSLWVAGGLLLALGSGLMLGVGLAIVLFALWCMASAVLIGRRRS